MSMQEEAVRFYYDLPGDLIHHKHRLKWRLSKDTMEALAGRELKDEDMINEAAPPSLMGIAIVRDDNAVGFHMEVIA